MIRLNFHHPGCDLSSQPPEPVMMVPTLRNLKHPRRYNRHANTPVLTLFCYKRGRHTIGHQPGGHFVLLYTRKAHDRTSIWCSPCFVTHEEGTKSMTEYPKEDRNESFNEVQLGSLIRMFNRHVQSRAYVVSQLLHRLSQE